ncbi:MAG: non-canonical purine NTP pyrophosphatase, RdgB/HAM1 family [Spirochaetes bacterium GWF1_31_7]|nr:MAG: non-canonical purine NTP pyrophosphatase, RdgB/HAM1 family [Spirochaetes bacterium GWE1_32_154]OHD47994.1 MAG: non-canonical purine NTP pyrophosphatase, RdgB/HAM1 family [Spirochaetes bacterium GWF1_31_7]OHD48085.1 MAG: non-canonical purine NTP pyrophosphatase, RdgB/HAM1 family [Spirochaetes bacterium GWE2_31_10]OHD79963.1 MAG: non-canonical purine NTP pyrophosphatase, RdgB/HAM1 family [Spirochaetes bacterium RIFOXYB1_FULL_32_8]HBD92795.1 non-canonical purine NTP pyrophosphatase, RdgB/H
MNTLILATKNTHKTKEFQSVFNNSITIEDLTRLQYNNEIIENGETFIENALIKCREIYTKFNQPVLADDSGLSVKALNGKPGVLSARFGGEGLSDQDRYMLLLEKMKETKEREASFVCALVLYISPNRIFIIQEECKGYIAEKPSGVYGFGYDPVFFLPQFNRSMAELSESEKNEISHRGKAAKQLLKLIPELFCM